MTTISVPDQTSSSGTTFTTPSELSGIGTAISTYTFRTMGLREIRDYTQHLAGRIKTIVDAAISDPQQNKAIKDLVHDAFWTEHYSAVREWAEIETRDAHQMPDGPRATHLFPFTTDHQLPVSI